MLAARSRRNTNLRTQRRSSKQRRQRCRRHRRHHAHQAVTQAAAASEAATCVGRRFPTRRATPPQQATSSAGKACRRPRLRPRLLSGGWLVPSTPSKVMATTATQAVTAVTATAAVTAAEHPSSTRPIIPFRPIAPSTGRARDRPAPVCGGLSAPPHDTGALVAALAEWTRAVRNLAATAVTAAAPAPRVVTPARAPSAV